MTRLLKLAGVTLAASLAPSLAFAQDTALNSGDTAWILTATALVLFMSLPGLALFYGGLVPVSYTHLTLPTILLV